MASQATLTTDELAPLQLPQCSSIHPRSAIVASLVPAAQDDIEQAPLQLLPTCSTVAAAVNLPSNGRAPLADVSKLRYTLQFVPLDAAARETAGNSGASPFQQLTHIK
jgi:hypothetical protein